MEKAERYLERTARVYHSEPAYRCRSERSPGHLEIAFEHPLRSGTLRVYVDDAQVLEEALSGKVTKKILNVRLRKGSVKQVLDVAPGEHVIRVEVDGTGWDGSRRIRGTFKSGETRRLEATLDGLIKKDLTLVWGR